MIGEHSAFNRTRSAAALSVARHILVLVGAAQNTSTGAVFVHAWLADTSFGAVVMDSVARASETLITAGTGASVAQRMAVCTFFVAGSRHIHELACAAR